MTHKQITERCTAMEAGIMAEQIREISGDLLAPEKSARFSPTWMQENVLNPAINAGPLGMYNTAADLVNLPTVHLKTQAAQPYSAEWFTQGLSSGVGAALPFMVMGAASGKAMNFADRQLEGTQLGTALSPYLNSQRVATIAGASVYGFLQKPDADHTRLGNAIGMGVGLAVFSKGNDLVKELPMVQKALAYPIIGFVGGGTMTEVSQLASNFKFAKNDAALQGAVQGMTMNAVMGLSGDYINKKIQEQDLKAENQRTSARSVLEQTYDGKNVKLSDITPGSKHAFARLAELNDEYNEFLKQNKPQYPHPDQFDALTPDEIVKLGFEHPDASNLDILEAFKGDKKPRPLPDAKVVASEVAKTLANMPKAEQTGDLQIGEWNMEFLTADKAKYFRDTYKEIIPRHHLLFVEEANEAGLKQIAQDTGYNYAISRENSRGQAVGFLIHPRLKVTGTESIESVAEVHNIPDLRPAFKIDVVDHATGEDLSAVVVHLKSMMGGPEHTAPVRIAQAQALADALGSNFKGIIAGDWNTFLDKTQELNPLKNAGFAISNPSDRSSTQSMGGRLDGFMTKGLNGKLTPETFNPFFKNPLITRGLSDHALLSTVLKTGKS